MPLAREKVLDGAQGRAVRQASVCITIVRDYNILWTEVKKLLTEENS